MRRNTSPANAATVIDVEATPVAEAKTPKLVCKVSGKVELGRKVSLRVDQTPGALLAVFGDRQDGAEIGSESAIPPAFSAQTIEHLASLFVREVPEDFEGDYNCPGLNAVLRAMSAFEPTNELEGMIAAQATAMHFVTMDSLARAQRQTDVQIRATNIGHANKCSRTFAALIETLNRHRGKTTTQRVIVENVTVQAGGQAVVGAVAGVGSSSKSRERAHEQTQTEADDRGPIRAALPCPEPGGQSVSEASGEGQETLQPSRRRCGQRGSSRKSERAQARALHGGSDHDATACQPYAERSSQPADGVTQ